MEQSQSLDIIPRRRFVTQTTSLCPSPTGGCLSPASAWGKKGFSWSWLQEKQTEQIRGAGLTEDSSSKEKIRIKGLVGVQKQGDVANLALR